MGFQQTYSRGDDGIGYRAQLRPEFDHRSSTEFGLLRTHVRLEIARRTGEQNTTGGARNSEGLGQMDARRGANGVTLFSVDRAVIQLGGLTAGRTVSFFDDTGPVVRFDSFGYSDRVTNVFAYSASLGSGFSATISAEDNNERRNLQDQGTAATRNTDNLVIGQGNGYNGGNATPDPVIQLRLDQSWGSLQLSGAMHEVRPAALTAAVAATGASGAGTVGSFAGTEWGSAAQLSTKINLPMIAAGDYLFLSANYSKGAIDYTNPITGAGDWAVAATDAVGVIDANGRLSLKLNTAMGFAAAFHHQFTPTVFGRLYGAYTKFEVPTSGRSSTAVANGSAVAGIFNATPFNSATGMNAGFQIGWNPVKNLTLITQIDYTKFGPSGSVTAGTPGVNGANPVKGSADIWAGRVRIQRDF